MRRLVVDLDGTITMDESAKSYAERAPNEAVIRQLHTYKRLGFEIVIHTARNMNTFAGAIGKINAHTLPIIIEWLTRYDVPYDEVHVGKPWCGREGFYVDDRAIRPAEFVSMSFEEIQALFGATADPQILPVEAGSLP